MMLEIRTLLNLGFTLKMARDTDGRVLATMENGTSVVPWAPKDDTGVLAAMVKAAQSGLDIELNHNGVGLLVKLYNKRRGIGLTWSTPWAMVDSVFIREFTGHMELLANG